MKIEIKKVKLSDIRINPDNPRTISEKAMERLVKSLKKFPDMLNLREIVVDETMTVLGGNMRLLALQKIGTKDCTAKIVTGLTPEQKREFIIKDNSAFGEWDMDLLSSSWSDLPLVEWGLDLPKDWLSGPDPEPKDAEPQIDKAEELNRKWRCETGQLWQIGRHRLLVGDSTKKEDVERLFGSTKPFLMVTDPPYGVNYDASWRIDVVNDGKSGDMAIGKVENDDIADWTPTWELFLKNGGVVCYIWHAGIHSPTVADSLYASGFELRNLIVWAKDRIAISRGNYHHQHEPCWYGVKKGENARFTEDRTQSTLWKNIQDVVRPGELVFVAKDQARKIYAIRGDRSTLWQIPKPLKSETGHSTQKPLECMARPIRNHDSEEVYDPFLGSGTTMVACQNLNRKCRGLEISPGYCAVILQRMTDAFPGIEIRRIDK